MLKLQENPVGHSWTSDFHQLISNAQVLCFFSIWGFPFSGRLAVQGQLPWASQRAWRPNPRQVGRARKSEGSAQLLRCQSNAQSIMICIGLTSGYHVEVEGWMLNHHKVSCWCWRSLIMNHRNIDCNVNSMLNVNSCWSWKSLNHRNQSQINSDKKITTLSSICSWRPASFQRGPVEYANNYQRTGRGLWSRASRASVFVCSPI